MKYSINILDEILTADVMRVNKMKTMFFHKCRLLQLSGIAVVTVCLIVYRMTPTLPALQHSSSMINEDIHYRKMVLTNNTPFRHPHAIMKSRGDRHDKRHQRLTSYRGHVATASMEEIDSHTPVKVKSKRPLRQYLELKEDTSIVLPIGNDTHIWVQMKTLKATQRPRPPLPKCPETFRPNPENKILDTLRHCDQSNLTFQPDLEVWLYTEDMMCEGRIYIYNKEGILLRDVVLDRSLWTCRDEGGDLNLNQTSPDEELCKPSHGAFKLYCDEKPVKFFKGNVNNHLTHWLENTAAVREGYADVNNVEEKLTITVQRYEYDNLYHSLAEMYNAYLVMKFYNETADNVNILVIDGHPRGLSDVMWTSVFPHTTRISALKPMTLFKRMFWSPQGHFSDFVLHSEEKLAYMNEFRNFILGQFGLDSTSPLLCQKLRVTLISRRDYLVGNRDPRVLQRKINNENEIIEAIKVAFPNFIVDKVQLEKYNFKDQLDLMVNTDIVIGMHGAGLAHVLFLPEHAAVIELIPAYWTRLDGHYRAIAKWRHLTYTRWENKDLANEVPGDQYTNVPTYIVLDRVREVFGKICPLGPH